MAGSKSRNAFLIHFGAYAAVTATLIAVNAMQAVEPGAAKSWWSLYAAAGWGIGVLAHGLAYWLEGRTRGDGLLADEDVRGVAVHLFVYLAVNALLIVVNVKTSPDTLWSVWPVLGWGAGLGAHAWLAYRKILKKTVERYASEQEILTQMQLERQAAEIAAAIEEQPEKKKAPAKRRKQAAKKTTKRAAARGGSGAAKRSAAKRASASSRKTTAKKPARRTAKKQPSPGRKKS